MQKSHSNSSQLDPCYLVLSCLFSVILITSNLVGLKLFRMPFFPSLALPSGAITYPLTFLLTDIVSEIWGAKKANFMVYLGFAMSMCMLVIVQVVLQLPPHEFWVEANNPFGYQSIQEYQNAYESVFSLNGKLLFGSMLAYLTAQLVDIRIFHSLKRKTKGRHLWLRNNGSTFISQLLDTIIVNSIVLFWGLHMEFSLGLQIMATVYLYKVFFAICDTPFVYLGVKILNSYKDRCQV